MTDFDSEGLLEGLDGDARSERLALLEDLHAQGVPIAALRRAIEENRLVFMPAELLIGGAARYTGHELAEKSGVPLEFLSAIRRAQGLPVPEPDELAYSDTDLEGAFTAKKFAAAGLPPEDMIDITRILGRGFSQAAEAMRAMVLKLSLQPGASERELATSYVERVAQLMPMTEPMLAQMLTLHLRHMAQSDAISAVEREAGVLPGAREVTVGFADLVGFTRVGEEVPVDELGRIAGRLAEMTAEVVRSPVRLVKTIGDAAMLTSPDAERLLQGALDLVDAADAEGSDFPQLRVGVASGQAVSRAGDWYGHPVNLASRVTGIARPGSVLVTTEIKDSLDDAGFAWSFAGSRRLKGIKEPVPLFRARRALAEGAAETE
jgi:adenylate cyclase